MYLSKLTLNYHKREVIKELANPYQLHRTVMSGFPSELPKDERILYRLEQLKSAPYFCVLVQSALLPNWQLLTEAEYLLRPAEIKAYTPNIVAGATYRFRLTANPTKRLKGDGETDGKRVGLFKENDQSKWLERKAEQNGFEVLASQIAKIAQPDGFKPLTPKELMEAKEKGKSKTRHRLTFHAVQFDGLLRVKEPDRFEKALVEGIGSGKGFGFGLLSIADASGLKNG